MIGKNLQVGIEAVVLGNIRVTQVVLVLEVERVMESSRGLALCSRAGGPEENP